MARMGERVPVKSENDRMPDGMFMWKILPGPRSYFPTLGISTLRQKTLFVIKRSGDRMAGSLSGEDLHSGTVKMGLDGP